MGLFHMNGNRCVGNGDIEQIVVDYFNNLFTSKGFDGEEVDQLLACVQLKLS